MTLNRTRHLEVKKKKKEEEPPVKVELILTKGLTKDLIDKYSIVNGGKYFYENESQTYLALHSQTINFYL